MDSRHQAARNRPATLLAIALGVATLIGLFAVWWHIADQATRVDTTPAQPVAAVGFGGPLLFADIEHDDQLVLNQRGDETQLVEMPVGQTDTPSLATGPPSLAPALAPDRTEMQTLRDLAEDTETTTLTSPSRHASPEQLQAYVEQEALHQQGWTGPELDALFWVIQKESSWRASSEADNPRSTALYLFQFLASTADNYGMHHRDLNGFHPTVEDQVRHGLQYIVDRYGTPTAAKAHWLRKGWY